MAAARSWSEISHAARAEGPRGVHPGAPARAGARIRAAADAAGPGSGLDPESAEHALQLGEGGASRQGQNRMDHRPAFFRARFFAGLAGASAFADVCTFGSGEFSRSTIFFTSMPRARARFTNQSQFHRLDFPST